MRPPSVVKSVSAEEYVLSHRTSSPRTLLATVGLFFIVPLWNLFKSPAAHTLLEPNEFSLGAIPYSQIQEDPLQLTTFGRQIAPLAGEEIPDVEITNITAVFQNVQLARSTQFFRWWMYSEGDRPFDRQPPEKGGVYAYTNIMWNEDSKGDGSCESGGNGRRTKGYLDPFNNYLGLNQTIDYSSTSVVLRGLFLYNMTHYNVLRDDLPWNRIGEAGDQRRYINGTLEIANQTNLFVRATGIQWFQNLTYPSPVGDAKPGSFVLSGYFTGELDIYNSDDEWVSRLDPHGTGYLLGLITATAFGPRECFATNSYWVTFRGFPDLGEGTEKSAVIYNNTASTGAKVGVYRGSNLTALETARTLANVTVPVVSSVVSSVVVAAVSTAVVTAVLPATGAAAATVVAGTGVARLIKEAAFVARINEIHGFHTDVMVEYGEKLRPFIAKFSPPFSLNGENTESKSKFGRKSRRRSSFYTNNYESMEGPISVRQGDGEEGGEEEEGDISVTEELFSGCAFYTTLIVVGFLAIHLLIWVVMRKKPIQNQVAPHAWMVYLFSIVMSYVHSASVLNSFQYLRSHVGKGTGKTGLMIVAITQLVFIGIGFTAFSLTITVLAIKRVRKNNVEWVPRERHPEPKVRGSPTVVGEYQAEETNVFHGIFESYYTALSGPRIWLVGVELSVTFLDAIFTAIIWDEIACLGVLLAMHSLLVLLFITLNPFVDSIEGRLVSAIGVVDLILLFLELVAALGDYDTAERMESAAIIIGFLSIGLAVLIAVYCDVIPMMQAMRSWLQSHVPCLRAGLGGDEDSVWSLQSEEEGELKELKKRSHSVSGSERDGASGNGSSWVTSKYIAALTRGRRGVQPWVAPFAVGQDMTMGSASARQDDIPRERSIQTYQSGGTNIIDMDDDDGQVIYTVWSKDENDGEIGAEEEE